MTTRVGFRRQIISDRNLRRQLGLSCRDRTFCHELRYKGRLGVYEVLTFTDELREAQKAYLLLQLLNAENHTLTKGDANKFA